MKKKDKIRVYDKVEVKLDTSGPSIRMLEPLPEVLAETLDHLYYDAKLEMYVRQCGPNTLRVHKSLTPVKKTYGQK